MQKIFWILLLIISAACSYDPEINRYCLEFQLTFPESAEIEAYEGIEVTLYNKEKEYKLTALSDANAKVVLDNMEAGFYSVSSSHNVEVDGKNIAFNAMAEIDILNHTKDSLHFISGRSGKFVIREYYYSGCYTPAGKAYLDDQYIEIYNNTSEVLFADGLSIVEHESYATSPSYWKFIEKDSIVAKMIWTVPGAGKEYPVLPGEGFLIARDAFDHKSDPNGNSNSPVDMGSAEFEFWSDKAPYGGGIGDVDFQAVNMINHFWWIKGSDVSFHIKGGSAIALVWLPGDKEKYVNENLISKESTSTTRYYCKIHNSLVEDAVEVMWNNKVNKRFDESLDAGYTFIEAGSKSGLCVRRKIKEVIDGRVIYQDTNNSTNDFEHDVTPKPKNYDF